MHAHRIPVTRCGFRWLVGSTASDRAELFEVFLHTGLSGHRCFPFSIGCDCRVPKGPDCRSRYGMTFSVA